MMEIKHEVPKDLLESIQHAGMEPRLEYALFAYGDILYIPAGFTPPPEILAHEEIHSEQHKNYPGGPGAWWGRYIDDPWFRIQQEAAAYARQYDYACDHMKDRNARVRYMHKLASFLASSLYGNVVGQSAAIQMIKKELV